MADSWGDLRAALHERRWWDVKVFGPEQEEYARSILLRDKGSPFLWQGTKSTGTFYTNISLPMVMIHCVGYRPLRRVFAFDHSLVIDEYPINLTPKEMATYASLPGIAGLVMGGFLSDS